jgi:hypothetical protein
MTRHALTGLSPSDVPSGPNAAALATLSACADSRLADGLAVAVGLTVADALAELGLGELAVVLDVAAGVARAAADEAAEDFEATLMSADPLEIKS